MSEREARLEAFVQQIKARSKPEDYIANLERELKERLKVNVGLVEENSALKRKLQGQADE